MARTKIADLSHYQNKIDWRKAATELAFCILRASVGVNNDKKYAEYVQGCKENGIPYGAYHYLKATDFDAAVNEAEIFFRAAAQGAPLFYVVDCEFGDITNAEKKKKGIAKSIVNTFVFQLKELAGSNACVGVYIGHHLYKSWALDYPGFAFVWIPRYGKNSGEPETRPDYPCDLWQFTSKGKLAGVSGGVDLNQLVGSKPLTFFTQTTTQNEDPEGGMELAHDPRKVIAVAEAEVGYLEKASSKDLDSKTANAGNKNYTKYARDMDAIPGFYNGKKQAVAWCDVFIDWCFTQAYGIDAGRALLCQPMNSTGAGCRYSRGFYKSKGQLHDSNPQPGDQIFFWPSDRSDPNAVAHTGLVYAADRTYVYTIEGNTSGASGVISNGGGVCKKKYKLNNARIAGYGRPAYGAQAAVPAPIVFKLGDRELRKGDEGKDVGELQTALKTLGYDIGTFGPKKDGVDNDYGTVTQTAVKAFQKKCGLTASGVFDAKTYTVLVSALGTAAPPQPEPPVTEPTYTLTIEGTKAALEAIQAQHGGTLALKE